MPATCGTGLGATGAALHGGGAAPPGQRLPSSEDEVDGEAHLQQSPPEWVVSLLDRANAREAGVLVYVRARSGWCCRRYALEAILFGVLMPLAVAGYWLTDAERREASSWLSRRYVRGECVLRNLLIPGRQVYHHGKYADAKDLVYQEGRVWRLEPAFNASVRLADPARASRRFGRFSLARRAMRRWPQEWYATTYTTVVEEERPHCEGMVRFDLDETLVRCADKSTWIPHAERVRVTAMNGTAVPCFIDVSEHTRVFLHIAAPWGFVFDVFLVISCVGIALAFAAYLVSQHRALLSAWFNAFLSPQRNSTERDGGHGDGRHEQGADHVDVAGMASPDRFKQQVLTPDHLRQTYQEVARGFNEMV